MTETGQGWSAYSHEPLAHPGSRLLAVWRIALFLSWTVALVPAQMLAIGLRLPLTRKIPLFYHRTLCRLLGFQVNVRGHIVSKRPTLFVCNHLSYIDIPMLASVIEGSFVSKAEVAGWPILGILARLQRTVFVDRRRGSTGNQRQEIEKRLEAGDALILFPEGTSGDGNGVLPFRSALFAAAGAVEGRVVVQPVTITYTHLDGIPIGRALRPLYCWYGAMELAPHAFELLGLGNTTVEILFHAPVNLTEAGDRKELARICEEQVSNGMALINSGHIPETPLDSTAPDGTPPDSSAKTAAAEPA